MRESDACVAKATPNVPFHLRARLTLRQFLHSTTYRCRSCCRRLQACSSTDTTQGTADGSGRIAGFSHLGGLHIPVRWLC